MPKSKTTCKSTSRRKSSANKAVSTLSPKAMKATNEKIQPDGHFQAVSQPPAQMVTLRYGALEKQVPANSSFVVAISDFSGECGLSYFDVVGPNGKITPETAPKTLEVYAGKVLSLEKVDEPR